MIVVTRTVVTTPPNVRAAYWRGAPYRALVADIAQDMGDQARVNVIRFGEPGGSWPKLSGFNANTSKSKRIKKLRERLAGESGVASVVTRRKIAAAEREHARGTRARKEQAKIRSTLKDVGRRADAGSWARRRQVDKLKARALVLPHAGYARRKAGGKTPGAGKFGPDVRLRDTGDLFAGLDGKPRFITNGVVISLVARGRRGGRPSNNDLLKIHAFGLGVPVRNPAQDMGLFLERTRKRVQQFLAGAPGVQS